MDEHICVIVKIAERCNLDCTYCYMYHRGDQSWKQRPAFLSTSDIDSLIRNLVEHSQQNRGARLSLLLHGGEPLLLGKRRMRQLLSVIRSRLTPQELNIGLQTNGVLLDTGWLDILSEFVVRVGISCDGPPDVHNRFRTHRNGAGSATTVEKAIKLCIGRREAHLFGGVLSVINPNSDGAAVVSYFHKLGVKKIDLLLPDANYISPPAHIENYRHDQLLCYLIDAFDEWLRIGSSEFQVRLFTEMLLSIVGRRPLLDALGGDISSLLVVESDGSYQMLDVLRICNEDATRTPFHVGTYSFHDFLRYASSKVPEPCPTCVQCRAFASCGGGYLPHRFDGKSYDNPSYYCEVLLGLYDHMMKRLGVLSRAHAIG